MLDWLPEDLAAVMRQEIAAAGGNEVFFSSQACADGIGSVRVLSRGNKFSVPVVTQHLKPGMLVIHNHPGGNLTPSRSDLEIAARLARDGIGFAIVNNTVEEMYLVTEPVSADNHEPVDSNEVAAVLGAEGAVSRLLPKYEYRLQQVEMAVTVANALKEGNHSLIEAATGTGKSLAYLVPIVLWALKGNRRVVVSTNTINLQEQLIYKDIPLLQKVLMPFKAVLVKGRGNYVCLRKFHDLLHEGEDLVEESDLAHLQALMQWVEKTCDGSRADLDFTPRNSLWELVNSDGDTCLRLNCPRFKDCFFTRARREAADAEVMVVNHHLLFADINLRAQGVDNAVLPSYQAIVFDEAHNLEGVATSWFGNKITRAGITRLLSRLYSSRSGVPRGLVPNIERKLSFHNVSGSSADDLLQRLGKLAGTIIGAQQSVAEFFSALESQASGQGSDKLRLTSQVLGESGWIFVLDRARQAVSQIIAVASEGTAVQMGLETLGTSIIEEILGNLVELSALLKRVTGAAAAIEQVLFDNDNERVRWMETYQVRAGLRVSLQDAPLTIADVLQEQIWCRFATVVLTSATLAVDGHFDYIRQRLGLNGDNTLCQKVLSSPFNYPDQVLMGVPSDLALPDQKEFAVQVASAIRASLMATQGRALVLFTSFSLLRSTAAAIRQDLTSVGISIYCQGDMPRHQLLNLFRTDTHSALLATASFWEGVDVAGDSLSSLIITRLPFTVPDEPVTEARIEQMRERGENPFYTYQVPQAILRFKQGFGRLIRGRTDRGVVLVLDRRLLEKSYGRQFISSLPPCPLLKLPLQELLARQGKFLTISNNHR